MAKESGKASPNKVAAIDEPGQRAAFEVAIVYPRRRRELDLTAERDEEGPDLGLLAFRLGLRRVLLADFFEGRPPMLDRFFEVVPRLPS